MSTATSKRTKLEVKDRLIAQGFLPIYVKDNYPSEALIEGAIDAGCTVLEYTCRRLDTREMIPWTQEKYPDIALIGATMVDGPRSAEYLSKTRPNFMTCDEMMATGVDGLISFLRYRPETYEKYGEDAVLIPGASTPNEAIDQLELGADFIKLPGKSPAGNDIAKALRVPIHSMVPIMVSGAITLDRVDPLVAEGALVLSAGFDLTLKADSEAGREITRSLVCDRVSAYLQAFKDARKKHQPELYKAIENGESNLAAVAGVLH